MDGDDRLGLGKDCRRAQRSWEWNRASARGRQHRLGACDDADHCRQGVRTHSNRVFDQHQADVVRRRARSRRHSDQGDSRRWLLVGHHQQRHMGYGGRGNQRIRRRHRSAACRREHRPGSHHHTGDRRGNIHPASGTSTLGHWFQEPRLASEFCAPTRLMAARELTRQNVDDPLERIGADGQLTSCHWRTPPLAGDNRVLSP
jgi:hypothetical protein